MSPSQWKRNQPPTPVEGVVGNEQVEYTGKYIVVLREDGVREGLETIKEVSGLKNVCSTTDFAGAEVKMNQVDQADVYLLDQLKIAVVDADPTQLIGLQSAATESSAILLVEPEQIMYALAEPPPLSQVPLDYLRGYRDAVNHLYTQLSDGELNQANEGAVTSPYADRPEHTWGLQATGADRSPYSGRGVRIAVLDTGIDLGHPDFVNRINPAYVRSFVSGQDVNDLNGHGTHCVGTSLGFQQATAGGRRYGCAYRGEIFVGKVLSNAGSGTDEWILTGINWAITNQCQVISMSLGAPVRPGQPYSGVYETVAQRALQSTPGTLIVAAAGNDSRRPGTYSRLSPPRPVGRPANCPSIMAVAAVDAHLQIAPFSNGGVDPNGGSVDIAGPGVAVFSSWPDPELSPGGPARYHTLSGTSMAAPHVAGIAAMWLEASGSSMTARALWQHLTAYARPLTLPKQDVGAGLVQAPL